MKKITVYDLPTRFFHWAFAFLFLSAFIIVKTVDDESRFFSYHMLAGLTIAFLLVLRTIWGFAGSTYARFSSFRLRPVELLQYFVDAVISKTRNYLGHNPASSYAAVIMFACAGGLATSGILMATGGESDFLEELHELLANIFLISVIVHIGGIVFHHLRHNDSLWSSMFDGKKNIKTNKPGIVSTRPIMGILFVVLTLSWMGYLYNNYNSTTQTLNLMGTELVLGEVEHESDFKHGRHDNDHDDD